MSEVPHPARRIRGEQPFIGRGLRDVWAHFNAQLQGAIQQRYPAATPAGNQVLLLIDREGTTVSELARRAGITKQSMATAVEALAAQGLVTRHPHPADRRARRVILTDDGWVALRFGLAVVIDLHARWTELIGADDMATLITLLERLAAQLDAPLPADEARGPG